MLGASLAPLRAGAAIVLALAIGFMVFCALRRTPWRRGPIEIDAPDTKLVLTQLIFTTVDVLAAAATLWVLLPSVGISFFSFAAIYAAALALGVLSHIPGGLGVFELAILYSVGRNAPVNAVAAALVTYRAIYFLLPMLLATVLLANFELQRSLDTAMGRRIGRAASQLAPHFLAVTTFVVGAILVVSGAMPAFVDRLQILQIGLPLWAVEVSHFLTSVAGLLLLFAAYGLYLRLDGAWWLAVCMTLFSIPFSPHQRARRSSRRAYRHPSHRARRPGRPFSRRASLLSQPLTLSWFVATGCVIAAMMWVLFFAFRNIEYAHELWWQFNSMPPRRALCVPCWPSPCSPWRSAFGSCFARPGPAQSGQPSRKSTRRGRSPLNSHVPTRSSRSWETRASSFSDSGRSFLMFATRGRTWVALGNYSRAAGRMGRPPCRVHRAC